MMDLHLVSTVDNSRRMLGFSGSIVGFDDAFASRQIILRVGGEAVARFNLRPEDMPASGPMQLGSVEVNSSVLLVLEDLSFEVVDGEGQPLGPDIRVRTSGDVFRALSIETPESFHSLIQLNHTRFASPVLLELGAWAAVLRFPDDFVVRNAALVVMAHRILERPIAQLQTEDFDRAKHIVDFALQDIVLGEELIDKGGGNPDWRYVRWTISLATVAGLLALLMNRYTDAATLFALNVRQVPNVRVAKVSALNLVIGCFIHGLLMSVFGMRDKARESFSTGLEAVKPITQAQNLFENVWVIGDLINVMGAARQCFIALVRLNLRTFDPSQPLIEPGQQIDTTHVSRLLRAILTAGRAPLLGDHLAAASGR